MGGEVGSASACYGSSLHSNPDISLKKEKKKGRHKQRSGQHTLAQPKKFIVDEI
jgi:hypothetical protein